MLKYRLTRSDRYQNPNCPGFSDLSRRQGYYFWAKDEDKALEIMREMFPDEKEFTCEKWS